ncbi:AMP-binding protein [Mesorhizobium sp.]|uniref:AMP-binding protein n=1 Tax=Mesorhizobium sp. TaxID=1871066 RepID=UPI00257D0A60|nr:AMP-binding protein [Mesorhizobium sp.]
MSNFLDQLSWSRPFLLPKMLGAAFVPVDPEETDQRLDHILRNTNAIAIVGHDARGSMRVERLPTHDGVITNFSSIAYIMHTSGTTGIPKGVPVSQAALLNLVDWYIDMIDFSECANRSLRGQRSMSRSPNSSYHS